MNMLIATLAAASLMTGGAAMATGGSDGKQAASNLSAQATNPKTLGWMQGIPPPADKTILSSSMPRGSRRSMRTRSLDSPASSPGKWRCSRSPPSRSTRRACRPSSTPSRPGSGRTPFLPLFPRPVAYGSSARAGAAIRDGWTRGWAGEIRATARATGVHAPGPGSQPTRNTVCRTSSASRTPSATNTDRVSSAASSALLEKLSATRK